MKRLSLLVFTLMLSWPATGHSHDAATGVVKERMELMKSMAANMKGIAAMVKGEVPFDDTIAHQNARNIEKASMAISKLFPEGSLDHPTEALPAIWQNRETFDTLAKRLGEQAVVLAAAAGKGKNATTVEFAKTGKICGSCHTDFRKKKEQ